jgi:Ca2+-binding RTX toxin-like protein
MTNFNANAGEFQVNTTTPNHQLFSDVCDLVGGGFVIVWASQTQDASAGEIYGQRYDAAGNRLGTEFLIGTFNSNAFYRSTEHTEFPSVSALASGGFVVTYSSEDGDGDGVYGQRYDAGGNKLGNAFRINTYTYNSQNQVDVATLEGGGFVVTHTSSNQDGNDNGIYGQRYDDDGNPLGAEFQINTYTTSDQSWSRITALTNGGFVVAWRSYGQDGSLHGIYGQRYDAGGNRLGAEFRINTYTTNSQYYPSITGLSGGGFVVTWTSIESLCSGGNDICGQLYSNDGNKLGSEFEINTYTKDQQYDSHVAALSDGGFIVTWTSLYEDGSATGIFGQRYTSNGKRIGTEFRINTFTTGVQEVSSVSGLEDGGFVVIWNSKGQDGPNHGIFAQRFRSDGTPYAASVERTGDGSNNILYGGGGDDKLNGMAGNDTLYGLVGYDLLNGGLGADKMLGGMGNDTYIIDNPGDAVIENTNSGIDTVESSINYTLGSNVENLVHTGTGNITGTGNTLNNVLTGNDGKNILDGKTGLDTMVGGQGDDTYIIDQVGELALITENDEEGTDLLKIGYANNSTTMAKSISLTSNLAYMEQVTITGTGLFNVTGNDDDNVLIGNASINRLESRSGDDFLDGKGGKDILLGGAGDDTYIVDVIGDQVIETISGGADAGGTDMVRSSVSWVLGDFVENLTLIGISAINGTGNGLNNIINGNGAANRLDGSWGKDTMIGGLGNDTYLVDDAFDTINETSLLATEIDTVLSGLGWTLGDNLENLTLIGSDNLNGTGNALKNILTGNTGANRLDGSLGADKLLGGRGNDTYMVDNTGDIVTESSTVATEIDTVESSISYTLGSNVENLILTGNNNINGTGNTANNVLTGNSGNNTLDGKTGLDTMLGGQGNDTYMLDQEGELALITENDEEGTDLLKIGNANSSTTVAKSISLTGNLAYVEQATLLGTGLFNVTGNDANNTLIGNASVNRLEGGQGNDTLDGLGGNDTLVGGAGNDTYYVNAALDVITENSNEGTDAVFSSTTYTLGANVENLTLIGTAALNGTGNNLNNMLLGNAAANILNGGLGADTLDGGKGNDTLTGGSGADTFLFDTALSATTNKDSITDFLSADDTIMLDNSIFSKLIIDGALSADNFRSNAKGVAADDNDYILYNTTTGGLFYDADGNKSGVAIQFATLTSKPQDVACTNFLVG